MMEIDNHTGRVSESFLAFDSMMKLLYSYFGSIYKGDRVAAIWTFLKPCRIQTGEYRRLTELAQAKLESMSGNLGQRLKDIYYQDVRSAGAVGVVLDQTEDFRYPINQLHQGLFVLRDKGEVAFDAYARATGMPLNDRARVRNTCQVRYPELQEATKAPRNSQATHISETNLFKLTERSQA